MLARLHAFDRLRRVHLRRRAEDRRIDAGQGERFGELGGRVLHAILRRRLARRLDRAADDGGDLDAADRLDGVEMLEAEGAGAGEHDLHACPQARFSRMMWPTAVFDAGT